MTAETQPVTRTWNGLTIAPGPTSSTPPTRASASPRGT